MLKLGTGRHHDQLLRGITSLDDVGCFALTELGFGEGPLVDPSPVDMPTRIERSGSMVLAFAASAVAPLCPDDCALGSSAAVLSWRARR